MVHPLWHGGGPETQGSAYIFTVKLRLPPETRFRSASSSSALPDLPALVRESAAEIFVPFFTDFSLLSGLLLLMVVSSACRTNRPKAISQAFIPHHGENPCDDQHTSRRDGRQGMRAEEVTISARMTAGGA